MLEVASSAVHMFSQRPGGAAAVVNSNGMPVLVKLLSPVHNATVIANIANAIGNMAGEIMELGRRLGFFLNLLHVFHQQADR